MSKELKIEFNDLRSRFIKAFCEKHGLTEYKSPSEDEEFCKKDNVGAVVVFQYDEGDKEIIVYLTGLIHDIITEQPEGRIFEHYEFCQNNPESSISYIYYSNNYEYYKSEQNNPWNSIHGR